MLKGKLICIDDVERKSKSLRLDELLGFIENLAEEQECKIILIFSEDKIKEDEEAKKNLEDYREKVIDIEIKLNPSAEENFNIGFGKDDPDQELIFNYIKREYAQTNNIRVLKKLKWILEKIRPGIEDFLPKTRQGIIEEVIFITLSKFDKNFPIDLEELVSLGDYSNVLDNRTNDDNKNLYFTAISFGYSGSLISDEIIRLVETSICDYKKIAEEGKKRNDREKQNKIKERLEEAYSPYRESFGSSEQDLCKSLTEFLDDWCVFLDDTEIINLEEIAKAINLDFCKYKKNWLKHQIISSDTLKSLNYWKSLSLLQEFPDLMREVEDKIKRIEVTMSITQVLSKDRAWSEEEVNYLNGRTVEDYKQWLLEKHTEKYYMVKQGLKMEGICSENLNKAIIDLARESGLNAMRAKNLYNINI